MNITNILRNSKYVSIFRDFAPLVIIFCWGFGQILPYEGWYLHGVSLPDILALLYLFLFIIIDTDFRNKFLASLIEHRFALVLLVGLITLLVLATILGSGRNSDYLTYLLLSIFRNAYFFVIALMVGIWATQPDKHKLMLILYLAALIAVLSWYVINSYSQESLQLWGTICGRPLVDQRNVVGNLMGVGLIFSVLLLLQSGVVSVLYISVLSYFLLYTFSKGAWLMGLTTIIGYFVVAFVSRRIIAVIFLVPVIIFGYTNFDHLNCLVNAKLRVSPGSNMERMEYLKNSLLAANKHLVGKGMGWAIPVQQAPVQQAPVQQAPVQQAPVQQAPVQQTNLPDISAAGYSSLGNPHSAFLHVLQTGGWGALVLYLMLFLYPFYLMLRYGSLPLKVAGFVAALAFGISGAVQLQIYSQQFYWIFSGFVFSIIKRPNQQY